MNDKKFNTGDKDKSNPVPPDKKPNKPIDIPPDHPGTPPDKTTPPAIDEPEPSKPRKIV